MIEDAKQGLSNFFIERRIRFGRTTATREAPSRKARTQKSPEIR